MHEPERSDAVEVAEKPANKAVRSAAGPAETRTATKGNAGQQARQRKKERFTALLHHINAAMLRTAFYALNHDAAPGVDGICGRITWRTSIAGSRSSTCKSKAERTGRLCRDGATFRRKTAASARWLSLRLRRTWADA